MCYGIIGAMPEEVEALNKLMTNVSTKDISGKEFIIGKLSNKDVVVTVSGIGKVRSAITAATLITNFKCSKIINVGIAGGLQNLNTLDVVLSTATAYHDVDVTAFGYKIGQLPGEELTFNADSTLLDKAYKAAKELSNKYNFTVYKGLIVTGDQFVSSAKQRTFIEENFKDALATEMEGSSIAHTCKCFNVPFLIIRTISDNANLEAPMTYEEMLPKACRNCQELLLKLLED